VVKEGTLCNQSRIDMDKKSTMRTVAVYHAVAEQRIGREYELGSSTKWH